MDPKATEPLPEHRHYVSTAVHPSSIDLSSAPQGPSYNLLPFNTSSEVSLFLLCTLLHMRWDQQTTITQNWLGFWNWWHCRHQEVTKTFSIHMRLSKESKEGTHASQLGFSERGKWLWFLLWLWKLGAFVTVRVCTVWTSPLAQRGSAWAFLSACPDPGKLRGKSLKAVSREISNMARRLYSSSPSPGVAPA